MIVPRDYQVAAAASVLEYFSKKDGNPLIAMPTGTGKSIVIAMILQMIFQYPAQRVIMATHVKELIQQNHSKLLEVWPQAPVGIYSAGLKSRDIYQPIIFAGIQSVAKKAHLFGKVDIIFIDEAHLVSPSETTSYRTFIKSLKTTNPWLKVIGLTATGYRLGHGKITEGEDSLFTDVCFDACSMDAFNWFIDEGYLSMLIPKKTKLTLDVSNVGTQNGDFKQSELQFAVDKNEITYSAIKEALELAHDRVSWLIFASGVDHAIHISQMLTSMGVRCACVHSKMSDGERDEQIQGFKSGKYRAISNNNVLTTGFDHPRIDLIIVLRPTKSVVLWVQMLGRGTRPVYEHGNDLSTKEGRLKAIQEGSKHNCLVLDFAANSRTLGPINDPVLPRKKGDKGGSEAPVKICPICNTYNHSRARYCIACGAEFVSPIKIKETAGTEALVKMSVTETHVFNVDTVIYKPHYKEGRPPSVRVTYYCGLKTFNEFVFFEHEGAAKGIGKAWWQRRTKSLAFPESTAEALEKINQLPAPTQIRVWTNAKPYPSILAHCFDGTSFGTKDASLKPVVIQTEKVPVATNFKFPIEDDDIPF